MAGTIHDVVPRGFDAYARVFQTVLRDRPVGRPWPPLPQVAHRRTWIAFSQDAPEIDAEKVTWPGRRPRSARPCTTWRDREAEQHGFLTDAESPSLV